MDAKKRMEEACNKIIEQGPPADHATVAAELKRFMQLFDKFLQPNHDIEWDKIKPLPEAAVKEYNSLPEPQNIKTLLDKLVVIKLNGGLGTSMGCKGPKSTIPVKDGLTFLDITVHQLIHLNSTHNCDVPLILMNSFNTEKDIAKALKAYANTNLQIHEFQQSKFPRIEKRTLLPVPTSMADANNDLFFPPGHGEVYEAFYRSGLLDTFIQQGKEYCFISNIDNLLATVDLKILNMLLDPHSSTLLDFVMEVTNKTPADIKGGTLIKYEDHLRLLEIAQVPDAHYKEFTSVRRFKIFNTNNLWVRLPSIKEAVEKNSLNMEIIVNEKVMCNGHRIIQLETAAGAAIKCFPHHCGINVPRTRFLPVKKTSDLLIVMSDLYLLYNYELTMNTKRTFSTLPTISLSDSHFGKVHAFKEHFEEIPDIIDLDELKVSGNVSFAKNVTLRGTVHLTANEGCKLQVPSGSILDNVTILKH